METINRIVLFISLFAIPVTSQTRPVFMGQNTPMVRPNFGTTNMFGVPNRGPPFRGPGGNVSPQFARPGINRGPPLSGPGVVGTPPQFTGPRNSRVPQFSVPSVNGRPVQPSGPVGTVGSLGTGATGQQQEQERWAPGEPKWVFPSTPMQWRNSCQRTGCSVPGSHCVFWGGLCPTSVRRTPCSCERGCKVDDVFIPFGQSKVMDGCNNICACYSREGLASCTARRC